ncbi:MAG: DEAD/DEAH box helicase family protein [bacterium]
MPNEAQNVDLKVVEMLTALGYKRGDTFLYQQIYDLSLEIQAEFGMKNIRPDFVLRDISGEVIAVIENKLEKERKALDKLRLLYFRVLKPRFLYACSENRILFYDTAWKGLEAGEWRVVQNFMSLNEMQLKIEQEKNKIADVPVEIDETIAGGYDPTAGKNRYYQKECIEAVVDGYKKGKQKMLVHMATGLGKTRMSVALSKAMLSSGIARRILFVVDRVLLADQTLSDGFSLISKEYSSTWIRSSNWHRQSHAQIHIVVIDTLENIFDKIPSTFYDLIVVDECHRSINLNRKVIFDHFLCPRVGLTATPRTAIPKEGKNIPEEDLAILDTYKLFGCETGSPDYEFDLDRGISEGFLAPYSVEEIKTKLTEEAEIDGIKVSEVLDMDTRERIKLDKEKIIKLEQLERQILSEERARRIAEEIKEKTQYGEKVILFAVSQAHCQIMVKILNEVFADNDEMGSRYAEAIISDNQDLNKSLKAKFKKPNQKPYIAVSVDIMSTGVDVPCVRYIAFAALTKSVGKYIQMLGRGARLDPKSGKFSFKVLDFVGLCKRMSDNGKGTPKENIIEVNDGKWKGWGGGGGGGGEQIKGIIENLDPKHLIQRVWIHGDEIKVIDNLPISEAMKMFEEEVVKNETQEVSEIKEKVIEDINYEPTGKEVEILHDVVKSPNIYLDEGQLQKVYDYQGGTLWDFFRHAWKVKTIPTFEERLEDKYEAVINGMDLNEDQQKLLSFAKDAYVSNYQSGNKVTLSEIFSNPIYEQLSGGKKFDEVFVDKKILDEINNVFV